MPLTMPGASTDALALLEALSLLGVKFKSDQNFPQRLGWLVFYKCQKFSISYF